MNKPLSDILEPPGLLLIDLERVIVPRINSIFTQLSRCQIKLLKSGEPDDFTIDLFVKLLLDFIGAMTKALVEAENGVAVLQHLLLSHLSKVLSMIFSKTFHIKQACAEHLVDLFTMKVKGSLESLSSENCETTPCILTDRADHDCRKSKTLAEKLKSLYPRCIFKRRPSCTEAPVSSESAVAAKDTMSHELLEIPEIRLDELMEREVCKEAKRISIDIIMNFIDHLSEKDYEESCQIGQYLKIIFTKQQAKDLVHQIVMKIKENVCPHFKPEDAESIGTLMDSVDSLIVAVTDDSEEHDDISVLQNYKNIFIGEAQRFTKGLSDLIYKHIKSRSGADVTPEPVTGSSTCTSVSVGPSDAITYAKIRGQVQNCLKLIGSFLKRRTVGHDVRQAFSGSGTETLAQKQPLDINKESLSSEDCKTTPCIRTDRADHDCRKLKTVAEKLKSLCPRCIFKKRPSCTEAPDRSVLQRLRTKRLAQKQPLDINKESLSSEDCKTIPCILTDRADHDCRKLKTLAEKLKSLCPRCIFKRRPSCTEAPDRSVLQRLRTKRLAQEQSLDLSAVEDRTPVESEDPELQTKKKEVFLMLLLEKLVAKAYKKAKIDIELGKAEAIIKKLHDETLAEVKDINFDTTRNLDKLHKVIFKELYKNSNKSHMKLLVSMVTEAKKVAKLTASSIRSHLTKPKQCSPVSKSFSSLCIFRKKNRVGVV